MPILCRGTDPHLRKRSYNYGPLKELAGLFYWYFELFEYQAENIIKKLHFSILRISEAYNIASNL